ncbi:MAG: hypothetical protein LBV73_27495 [Paraburkholderia sp.]|jgi:hypothetical protein|nr:hypothetical protein [Paraburkholderia sp.]
MKIVFDLPGDFAACYAAEEWCRERGIAVGAMQGRAPRGLKRGNHIIWKWRSLDHSERRALDGTMTGDMRNGPVTINLNVAVRDHPETGGQ